MSSVTLQIEASPQAVAQVSAKLILEALHSADGPFSIALAGGSTPRRLYEELATQPEAPWAKARLFLGDERALPLGHADRNSTMVERTLVRPLGLDTSQVFLPTAGQEDLHAAAEDYEAQLLAVAGHPPRLDIVLLGMGGDGHTASLFPGHSAPSGWVAAVSAPEETAAARRITLTAASLISAKRVFVLVTGASKAQRLADVFEGRDEGPLAQILEGRSTETRLIVDMAATARLGTHKED